MSAVNVLPKRDPASSTTGCCPPFDPKPWDEQTFTLQDKLFMKVTTRSFMHIPINMNAVMKQAMAKIEAAHAHSDDYLMLSEDLSPWRAQHYIAVSHEVPGAAMVRLSGTFLAKVFEGPYQEMPHWYTELGELARSHGKTPTKIYFSYTMCPNCAKAYGHNYTIGFAQI